jgi:hypothetical protein
MLADPIDTKRRRENGAILHHLLDHFNYREVDTTFNVNEFVGQECDGQVLERPDVTRALDYLERCYGAVEYLTTDVYVLRNRNPDLGHSGDAGTKWHTPKTTQRRGAAVKAVQLPARPCGNCNLVLRPNEDECPICGWTR